MVWLWWCGIRMQAEACIRIPQGNNRIFFSEIHPKHINTLCESNLEFFNVRSGGTFSNYGAQKDY